MLIALIFSVLSATFTIVEKQAVEYSGSLPSGSSFYFSSTATTGQKGQLTAGNSLVLGLAGWDGVRLKGVSLSMHSNAQSGAGELAMWVGDTVVWNIADNDFAAVSWNGSYTTAWSDIECALNQSVGKGDTIWVEVYSSKNSLYVQSFTLTYEGAPPPQDTIRNDTMVQDTLRQVMHLTDGVFALGMEIVGEWYVMDGAAADNHIALRKVNAMVQEDRYVLTDTLPPSCYYEVSLLTDSTLFLRHIQSNQWIGCTQSGMRNQQTMFRYGWTGSGSLAMYWTSGKKSYCLWPTYGPNMEYDDWVVMPLVLDLSTIQNAWICFAPDPKPNAVETILVNKAGDEVVYSLGIWEMRIKDGKKQICLRK